MAAVAFTIWDSVTFDATDDTNGVLATSNLQVNSVGFNSLRLIADYELLNPDGQTDPANYDLQLIIETQSTNGRFFTIAYQFNTINNSNRGTLRQLILQPNMDTFNTGIDDVVFAGNKTIARISRQQGKLGPNFRVRLLLNNPNPGQTGEFNSVKISVYGEWFDA